MLNSRRFLSHPERSTFARSLLLVNRVDVFLKTAHISGNAVIPKISLLGVEGRGSVLGLPMKYLLHFVGVSVGGHAHFDLISERLVKHGPVSLHLHHLLVVREQHLIR